MLRQALALVAAAALAAGALAPSPARAASEEDIAKILAGLAALAIVGKALSDRDRDDDDKPPVIAPHRPKPKDHYRPRHDAKTVPVRCLRTYETRQGVRRVVMRGCAERTVAEPWKLPRQCLFRVQTRHGPAEVYGGRCLRKSGYRLRTAGS
ncbi:MAG: hypothetical protein ACLFTP_09580 [Rhodosalinus sp.]|uniref:hypothetical protein n=1 Tax=Rhodosalinus sp. TaxID=2047741 RepID=UPI00397D45F6